MCACFLLLSSGCFDFLACFKIVLPAYWLPRNYLIACFYHPVIILLKEISLSQSWKQLLENLSLGRHWDQWEQCFSAASKFCSCVNILGNIFAWRQCAWYMQQHTSASRNYQRGLYFDLFHSRTALFKPRWCCFTLGQNYSLYQVADMTWFNQILIKT